MKTLWHRSPRTWVVFVSLLVLNSSAVFAQDLYKDKTIRFIDGKGDERLIPFILHARLSEPEAKGVTLVSEAIKGENHLRVYRTCMAQMDYSRPLTIAPNTPKDRLEILRRAFKATLADGDSLAQTIKLQLNINYVSGEESEKWVGEVLSLSPKLKEELKYLPPVQ